MKENNKKEKYTDHPRAVFVGWQKGVEDIPSFPLYNVFGHEKLEGSTVSANTLEREHIDIPPTPEFLK